MPPITAPDAARARRAVDALTARLIAHQAERRQGHGRGEGARPPAALGQAPRRLVVLTEPRLAPSGQVEPAPVTPLGYHTPIRALPPVLARLDATDPRRRAADMLAHAVERIGSVSGGDPAGGAVKGLPSDGGATTRVKHAARLRMIEALANGWPVDRAHGQVRRGAPRIVLPVLRQRGNAREITAMGLLLALCVDGQDMRRILTTHGRTTDSAYRKRLAAVALMLLDELAEGLGLGRADPDARLDA